MTSNPLDKPRTLSEAEFNKIKKLSSDASLTIPEVALRYGDVFKGLAVNEDPYKVLTGPKFDEISKRAFNTLKAEIEGPGVSLSARASDFLNSQWQDMKKTMGSALQAISGREAPSSHSNLKAPATESEISNVASYINNFLKNAAKVNPEYSSFSPDTASIKAALAFDSSGNSEKVLAKGAEGGFVEFNISKDNLQKISEGRASQVSNELPKKDSSVNNSFRSAASSLAFER